jgi:hypothetical protein
MFDPKKFLAEDTSSESSGFDPKAFLAGDTKSPEPESSKLEAGVAGLGQGITMGFGEEIAGAADALTGGLPDKISTWLAERDLPEDLKTKEYPNKKGYFEGFGERYTEGRESAKKVHKQLKEENPWTYGISQGAGALGTGLIGGVPATTGKLLLRAGAEGAAYGLGESEADLTKGEFGQAAKDTLQGGVIGAGSAGVFKAAPKVLGAIGKTRPMQAVKEQLGKTGDKFITYLKDMGAEGATDVMKASPADKVKLGRSGVITAKGEASNVANEMPKYLGELGVGIKEGVNPFATLKSLHKKVLTNMDQAGKKIGMVEDKYSEVMNTLKGNPNIPDSFKIKLADFERNAGVDILDMAVGLEKQIQEKFGSNPVFKSQMKKVATFLDDMVDLGAKNVERYDLVNGKITSLKGLQRYRKDVDKVIKEFAHPGNKQVTAYQELLADTRGYLSKHASEMTDQLDQLGKLLQDAPDKSIRNIAKEAQGLTKQLRQANRDYTMGSHASGLIEKGMNHKGSMFSIKDLMLGFGGSVLGDPTLGAGVFAAKKGLDIMGPRMKMKAPAIASGLETIGKFGPKDTMQKTSNALTGPLRQPYTQQTVNQVNKFEEENRLATPLDLSKGTKYEQVFTGDSQEDAVKHKILMSKDPNYKKMYMGEEEEE